VRIESLLLAVTRVTTFRGDAQLSNATGFFFRRAERVFLVTNRHVVHDEASGHRPDRLEIELHVEAENAAAIRAFSIPLYGDGRPLWRQGCDSAGPIDVAVVVLDLAALPAALHFAAFTPAHLVRQLDEIEVGTSVLVVGFPLGFHDTLHHLPVARQAVVASAFGIRFQGNGYFLTDARTHRGMSGAPVVTRMTGQSSDRGDLAWMLLGIHGARLDMGDRDLQQDEGLALNCAWYADILRTLTQEPAPRRR
jgi:S1-C subfamily serine protease